MTTENDILRRKFRATGFDKPTVFRRHVGSEVNDETYNALIYRDKPMRIDSLLKVCSDLGMDNNEIADICVKRGEKTIARLLRNNPLTAEEKKLLEKIKAITDKKKLKLVEDLLDSLGG